MAISADEIEFTLRLRDQMSAALKQAAAQLDSLGESFDGVKRKTQETEQATKSLFMEILKANLTTKALEKVANEAADALKSMSTALFTLGSRGSDISSVSDSLVKFVGTAEAADEIIERLRKGTLNTITDFDLMKTSTKLLGAGVKLTADQFGDLAEAAVTLKNRGLGDTKQMLDLVSDAMVTGRTRTLAMKLGVVDTDDAVRKHAASLGLYENQLSQAQRADAMRIAILDMVRKATADAGTATQDFGDILKAGSVAIDNFWDKLGRSIADSPKVMAAMRAMQKAISDAFGPDSQKLIDVLMGWINKFADAVTAHGPRLVQWVKNVYDGAVHYGGVIIDWLVDIKNSVVKIYEKVTETWDTVPDWLKEVAKYSAIAAVGAQGAAMAVTGMTAGYLEMTASFATITSGLKDFSTVIIENGGLLKTIFVHPLFAAAGAVVALAFVVRELTGSWEFITRPLAAAWDALKSLVSIITDLVAIITMGLIEGLKSLFRPLLTAIDYWKQFFALVNGESAQAKEMSWLDDMIWRIEVLADSLKTAAVYLNALRTGKLPDLAGGPKLPKGISVPSPSLFSNSKPTTLGPKPLTRVGGGTPGSGLPPETPERDLVGEAVTRMMEEASNSIINAKAALEYHRRDAFTTTKEAESLYGAMQAVVDKFGYSALESKLGRDAKAIYDYFDGTIGTIHAYSERLRAMAMQTFKPGSLPRPVDVKSIFGENPTTNPWFAGGAQGIRPFMSRNFANISLEGGPGGLFSRERNPFLWTPGIGSAGGANQVDLLRKRGIFGQNLKMTAPGKSWTQSMLGMTMGDFGSGLGSTVMGALQGGGNVGGAVGGFFGQSMGSNLAKSLGKTAFGATGLGSMIGSFLPGVGALLGPLMGKAFSAIGNMFGMNKAGRDTVRTWEDQFGGGDAVRTRLSGYGEIGNVLSDRLYKKVGRGDEAGAKKTTEEVQKFMQQIEAVQPRIANMGELGKKMWDELQSSDGGKGTQDALDKITAAIKRQEEALGRLGIKFDDFQDLALLGANADTVLRSISQFGDDLDITVRTGMGSVSGLTDRFAEQLNNAIRTTLEMGGKLAPSFKPFVEMLARSGQLAGDVAYTLLGIPTQALAPWKEMQEAAERFGVSLDSMGAAFEQSKLVDTAKDLSDAWGILVHNGADVNAVMEGMKDEAQSVLDNAKKFGLEIPISMKPMLEAMVSAGLLTGDAGLKLEDLSGFKFSEDLTTKIDDLVTALGDLVEVLGNIPSPVITPVVNPPVFVGVTTPPPSGTEGDRSGSTDPVDRGRPGYEDTDGQGHAFFGVVPHRPGGTKFRIGEGAEDEWVVPDSRMKSMTASGEAVDRTVLELQRIRQMMERQQATLALAVRDAMLLSR